VASFVVSEMVEELQAQQIPMSVFKRVSTKFSRNTLSMTDYYSFNRLFIPRRSRAIMNHLMLVLALPTTPSGLDNKRATINRVNNRVSAGEGVMRPSARIPQRITTTRLNIIRRVHIKVCDLLDARAIRVARDRANVQNAETSLVVGLVRETINDKLVVVDGARGGLVVAGHLGGLEVLDVPDVGYGEAVFGGRVDGCAVRVDLSFVKLVVHDNVRLPELIGYPTYGREHN
jgi:hypothetical protein